MSVGHTASSVGGSFIHSTGKQDRRCSLRYRVDKNTDNPFGPNAALYLDVDDQMNPTGKVMVIPDWNVLATNLQTFDSGLFNHPNPPTPSQIWAIKAARTSVQLALLVGLTTEMQETVGGLTRPEWEKRLGALRDTLKQAHDQALFLCGAVDPNFKPPS